MLKIFAIVTAAAGIIALILSFVDIIAHTYVLGVTGAGYLRGATAMFLLSLVLLGFEGSTPVRR